MKKVWEHISAPRYPWGGSCPGVGCPGGNCPRWQLSWVAVALGGSCPDTLFPSYAVHTQQL